MTNQDDLTNELEFSNLIKSNSTIVVNFYASWAPQCQQMTQVFNALSTKSKSLTFLNVNAEQFNDISDRFNVVSVPTFVCLRDSKELDRICGANPAQLNQFIDKHEKQAQLLSLLPKVQVEDSKESIMARVEALTKMHKVMLFIKGTPSEPRCGFTAQLLELLEQYKPNLEYNYFDILSDEQVRSSLKEYANWPTYPQIWVNGALVGGLDIIKELHAAGELEQTLDLAQSKQTLEDQLKSLINQDKIMLFMKGSPSDPQCGFSRRIVDLLNDRNIRFSHFDILLDDQVRQGLKAYSNWPTYPQLYIKGELVGGLDIVTEMIQEGDFDKMVLEF